MEALFPQLLAAAILVHEALYLCRDGKRYFTDCFLPTLGLQLSPGLHATLHAGLVGSCLVWVVRPESVLVALAVLVLLALVIASYSLRVSNHLILAFFMTALVCWSHAFRAQGDDFVRLGVLGLMVSTYLLACFHKLNTDYFSLERSCSAQLAGFYCWDRGIRDARWVRAFKLYSIYSTVVMEAAIAIFLLAPSTRKYGVLAAILFHFSLALLGIVNFSAVMYAGLIVLIPVDTLLPSADSWPLVGAFSAIFAVAALILTPRRANRHCPYRWRAPAWVIQAAYAIVACWLLLHCLSTPRDRWTIGGDLALLSPAAQGVLLATWLLFGINGIAPYLGIKTEFSFSMFSNLRHRPWRHLIVPDRARPFDLSSYVRVEEVTGLPALEAIEDDPGGLLAWLTLSRPQRLLFGLRFLSEAVRRLAPYAQPTAPLRIRFRDPSGERRWMVAARGEPLASASWRLHANLFPFVAPVDPDSPHSEQGLFIDPRTGRQVF